MKDVGSEIRLSPLNVHSYINIDKIFFSFLKGPSNLSSGRKLLG